MRTARTLLQVIALCLSISDLSAQAPDLAWQRCLGGALFEYSWGVQATSDGGCAVLGITTSYEGDVSGQHGQSDFWLARLNAGGMLQWQRCYGGTDADLATRLLTTDDGGFLMLGSTSSADGDVDCNGNFQHAWAVKVDSLGAVEWQACLAGDQNGSGGVINQAIETGDEGYLVVGGTYATQGMWQENHGQSDFFAAKLSAGGTVEWVHCYGGSGSDEAWVIKASPDGNYVIAGTSGSTDGQVTTGSSGQVWVLKINGAGDMLWNRRMGGNSGPGTGDDVKDLVMNPDGSILVAASSGSNDGDVSGNHGAYDVWLVHLDSTGAILQKRCFGGTGNEYAWGAEGSAQGRYVVAGTTTSNDGDVSGNHGGNGQDAWVLMVDSSLDLVWQKCLGGSGADEAYAVARNPAGEIFTSGQTYSEDGDVSGLHSSGVDDIWVVKLDSDIDTGVDGPESTGMAVFPSPATDVLHVQLSDPLNANATLDVMDITGRVVLRRRMDRGISALQIPVNSMAAGMYCLRLEVGNKVLSTRFLKHPN